MAEDPWQPIVVTDLPAIPPLDDIAVLGADEYLEGERGALAEDAAVINLCRSYHYLSNGYYVSLVADARNQRVFPTLQMIEAVTNPAVYLRALREAGIETIEFAVLGGGERGRLLPKIIVPETGGGGCPDQPPAAASARPEEGDRAGCEPTAGAYVEVTCIFGKTRERRFRRQCAAVFRVYAFPLLKIRMYEEGEEWKVGELFPASADRLDDGQAQLLAREIARVGELRPLRAAARTTPHRIACLHEPDDELAPSDENTLEKFARAARRQGVVFERIGRNDLARLPEYDALFIRTVTATDHYSFTFAQTAESLGMPVIDDPQSIVRCSNKVYLHELFRRHGLPTPRTMIVSRKTPLDEACALGFPLIVKLPDGAFSQAVKKVADPAELEALCADMFRHSPLLIVQEFAPTTFDWRVGVLEGRALYVCKYYMAKDHWQIAKRYGSGFTRFGRVEAFAVADAPPAVMALALEGAALIGEGLYGVDIKEGEPSPVIIEINDNPTIETGCEDAVEKDRIYEEIICALLRRIHKESAAAARPA